MASSSFRSRTTGRNCSQRRGELATAAVPVAGSLHRDLDTRNEVRYYWKVIRSLAVPPGNELEALRGDRKGQHSIRVNQQWRVCFVWKDGDVTDAEIVDYH